MTPLSRFTWLFVRDGDEGTTAAASVPKKDAKKDGDSEAEEELGVTEELKAFVRGFTVETFKSYPVSRSEGVDEESGTGDPNVRHDLTDWQERHAVLALSKVKELAQLRYKLCPGRLKEAQFWNIYFLLVKNYTAPYEIRALQKQKLKTLESEEKNAKEAAAIEVEMTETKQITKGFIAYNEI